jgi:hypothetical protein
MRSYDQSFQRENISIFVVLVRNSWNCNLLLSTLLDFHLNYAEQVSPKSFVEIKFLFRQLNFVGKF